MTTDHWGYEQEKQPDIVEVIRCKYCDHWDDVPIADERQDHECHLIDGNKYKIRIVTPPDWFCPAGERREKWSNILKAE